MVRQTLILVGLGIGIQKKGTFLDNRLNSAHKHKRKGFDLAQALRCKGVRELLTTFIPALALHLEPVFSLIPNLNRSW